MKDTYLFEYINENEFKKLERSIKKYNMLAYKKLYFEYYPSLKEGNFLGEVVDEKNGNKTYELKNGKGYFKEYYDSGRNCFILYS